MQYRGTFRLELVRKLVHVAAGLLIVLLVQAGFLSVPVLGMLMLLLGVLVLYNWRYEKELLSRVLAINRADARVPGLDVLAFFLGCWLVLVLFRQEIALAAILILAVGDSVAHLVSRRYGGTSTFLTKTTYIEGTVAGIMAASLAAWLSGTVPLIPAIVASVVAMFVEAGELRIGNHHIDDNLLIPVVAAITLWILDMAFPFI